MLLLPARVTLAEANDILRLLSQAQRSETPAVVVDAGVLEQFDTSLLAVLLECHRLAKAWGKAFRVQNPPAKLEALARLYGVEGLLFAPADAAAAVA